MISLTQEEKDYLHCKGGSRHELYKLELIDSFGVKKKELLMTEGSISLDADIGVQKIGVFSFAKDDSADYISDRVKPYMGIILGNTLKWWPLGVFLLSKPKSTANFSTVKCYDESLIINQSYILEAKLFLAGTNYVEVLRYLLISCGVIKINIEPTELTLQTDIVLDDSKTKLEWFNYIASQINYTRLSIDSNGWFTSRKYVEPSQLHVDYIYEVNKTSMILDGVSDDTDYRNIPNVFKRIVSHPTLGDMISIYKNEDPTSKFSIKAQKREIVDKKIVDNIASQIELDVLTRKAAFNSVQITKTVNMPTLNMPHHGSLDILDLRTNSNNGIFVEHGWNMNLKAGAIMNHKVKRLVRLE